jgi:HEAT repeats
VSVTATRKQQYREVLRARDPQSWVPFLREHSGLPGPRANLELVEAVADIGDLPTFESLVDSDDEYLVLCGVVGLGQILANGPGPKLEKALRVFATDGRWRVREGVAMAVQRLGDADPARLRRLTAAWASDPDPLIQRAAVAGMCEPRLLTSADNAAHALALCQEVTDSLAARPAALRTTDAVRTLRKALGYCWSVAVAADPAAGLPLFTVLSGQEDSDLQWIVRENRKKSRLARLL